MTLDQTVLIVDDEEDVLETLKQSLSKIRCNVITTDNVESACDTILDTFIDIVVTDVRMPGGTGIDLLKRIQELPPNDRPVIIVISGNDDFTEDNKEEYAVTAFLQKPFSLDRFAKLIKSELNKL
jgi:DNA-binding NtrC family response regulator